MQRKSKHIECYRNLSLFHVFFAQDDSHDFHLIIVAIGVMAKIKFSLHLYFFPVFWTVLHIFKLRLIYFSQSS